jgi:hypothetical protein
MTEDMGVDSPKLRSPWLRTLLKAQWLGATSLIVSALTLLLPFWKPDDLVVYFRFNDPWEVGTKQLHLNYIFSNSGKNPAFVEDVSLVTITYRSQANNSMPVDFSLCNDTSLPTPLLAAYTGDMTDYKGRITRLYKPKEIYLGGSLSVFSSLNIDAGSQRAISTMFETEPVDWNKSNAILLCPVVRFFDSSGQPHTEVCPGYQRDQLDGRAAPNSRFTPASGSGPARLLPKSGSSCTLSPF